MQFKLRPYQQQAVDKAIWAMKLSGNDLLCLPTGSGKSLVIAEVARRLEDQKILILQPSKEILEQNMDKLRPYFEDWEIGVYSASMNRKDRSLVTLATIQSCYKRPELFQGIKLVIIDEAHTLNVKNTAGMLNTFLAGIGNPKVLGLTATPYRNMIGYLKENYGGYEQMEAVTMVKLVMRLKERFWARLLFNLTVKDLLEAGHLCPLRYYNHKFFNQEDLPLNKSRSDFDQEQVAKMFATKQDDILNVLRRAENAFKSCLVFCASVGQAENFARLMPGSAVVTAKTHAKDRELIVEQFKRHQITTVFNVGCFTTGFDHPALDFIGLLRPTRSISLYGQMVGRALRNAPGKEYGMITDFTDTVRQMGRVETIRVERVGSHWELLSETEQGTVSWHGKELYRWKV